MSRTTLIWFAAGAATSAAATTGAWILNTPAPDSLMLRLHEPEFDPTLEQWAKMSPEERKLSNIAVLTGELTRDCGIDAFSIVLPGSSHSAPYVEFNVLTSRPAAIECVLGESRQIDARVSLYKTAEK